MLSLSCNSQNLRGGLNAVLEEKWQCDRCNKIIHGADKAWLKWKKNLNDGSYYDFKIVHHPACQQPSPKVQKSRLAEPGNPLSEYLGKDGLIRLLELVAQTDGKDRDELLKVIQRLQIPGYESAHINFESAYKSGELVPPTNGVFYPTIHKIKEINEEYIKNENYQT